MTREEEIQKAAVEARCAVATSASGDNYSSIDDLPFIERKLSYDELIENAFIRGAEWADNHTAKKQAVTIEAWVAREGNFLGIYKDKPFYEDNVTWVGGFIDSLPNSLFPSVTFENSPKKVKVTIELEDEQ